MSRTCRRVFLLVVLMAAVNGLALPASAQDCLELAARWSYGPAYAADVSGSSAYFGSGTVLVVVDVSPPSPPFEVGWLTLLASAYGVAAAGGYAYVADSWRGTRAIDVSNPSAPATPGSYETPGSASCGVTAAGGLVYLAEDSAGLEIFWDCDPSLFVGGFESGDTSAWPSTVP